MYNALFAVCFHLDSLIFLVDWSVFVWNLYNNINFLVLRRDRAVNIDEYLHEINIKKNN